MLISPAMRRELADVRSIRTATSSHSSSALGSVVSVPPNHQTFNSVEWGLVLKFWNLVVVEGGETAVWELPLRVEVHIAEEKG